MSVSLFSFVDIYSKALATLDHLLGKGAEFAAGQGASEADMLGWRLIDDMNPLSFQVSTVVNFSRQWTARAVGAEPPAAIPGDLDLAGYRAAIAAARAELAALTPAQFAGRDDVALKVSLGPMEPTLPIGQWITGFATTNIQFHLSMAYAILRARGVQIGKIDLFAGGL